MCFLIPKLTLTERQKCISHKNLDFHIVESGSHFEIYFDFRILQFESLNLYFWIVKFGSQNKFQWLLDFIIQKSF